MKNRIVSEIFLEKPNFREVSKVSQMLNQEGINTILLPPEDRNINTHLVVELNDLPKVREIIHGLGIDFMEKEVILIRLENRPGTMAEAATKIASRGVNLNYAFSVTMNDLYSLVLIGSDDNLEAVKSLE